jgi:hypothetical protein
MEGRKQAVSIRLGSSDLRNLRKLARRMNVRHSDIIRFAIRTSIARLAPLLESEMKGKDLVPMFVESGADLVRYLDLDAASLEAIINAEASDKERVDRADIMLLAGLGVPLPYMRLRLSASAREALAADTKAETDDERVGVTLRKYFYDKYINEQTALAAAEAGGQAS